MTLISSSIVLQAITEIENAKREKGVHPPYVNDFDLIAHFRIIPKVALDTLISKEKIKKGNTLNCYFYQII